MSDNFETWTYFSSPVYIIKKPEFLESARKISYELLDSKRKEQPANEIYPLYNTDNFYSHKDVSNLSQYIMDTSWNILDEQGYDMSNHRTFMDNFWCQEHLKNSGHDRHIHGSMISGFYFLDCPEGSCKLVIHEPRSAKDYMFLPEKNINEITHASKMIYFTPNPGTIIFTNSWLPHSFTKNESNDPFRMIHFGITAKYVESVVDQTVSEATVI